MRGIARLAEFNPNQLSDYIRDKQAETFIRLHALVRKGYIPDFTMKDCHETIWLQHPSPKNPDIILYPDGTVTSIFQQISTDDRNPTQIFNEKPSDSLIFEDFLLWLTPATWGERTAKWREKYIWMPVLFVSFYGFCFGASKIFEWVWRSIIN